MVDRGRRCSRGRDKTFCVYKPTMQFQASSSEFDKKQYFDGAIGTNGASIRDSLPFSPSEGVSRVFALPIRVTSCRQIATPCEDAIARAIHL